MNKKKLIFVAGIIIVAGIILFFWLSRETKDIPVDGENNTDGLFFPDTSSNNQNPGTGVIGTTTDTAPDIVDSNFPEACSDESTTIERNGCIAELAVQTKDTNTCDFIVGSLPKASCMNSITQKTIEIPKTNTSYQDFLESSNITSPLTKDTVVSSSGISKDPVKQETDSRYTAEGFSERYTSEATLSIYALSQYQAKPGETVTIYGSGFVYPNTVLVGSTPIQNVKSPDGFSLTFTAPTSGGSYEISVSNSKGTTAGQKPVLIVTDNPAPRPQITGATPSIVGISDDITLTGTGFTQDNTVSTTLGFIEHVSSSGSSIRFNISKLSVISQIKDLEQIKGKVVSVGVYISNKNGFNKDLFYFDVQF